MNELTRMHYLDAMGVESFVPRFRLPNAGDIRQAPLPAAIVLDTDRKTPFADSGERDSTSLSLEVVGRSVRALETSAVSMLVENQAQAGERIERKVTAERAAPTSVSEIVARTGLELHKDNANFILNLWFTDTDLQIVDTREAEDALPTQALLSNILMSNNLLRGHLSHAESQCWPLPGGYTKDQSWQAAYAMFTEFFDARFQKHTARAFICFGEAAAKVVLGDELLLAESEKSAPYKTIRSERHAKPVLMLPALRDFLYTPALKRHIWPAFHELRDKA